MMLQYYNIYCERAHAVQYMLGYGVFATKFDTHEYC